MSNLPPKEKVKRRLSDMLRSGDIEKSPDDAMKQIFQLVPDAKDMALNDWKEIELHYQIILSEGIVKKNDDSVK